MPTPNERDRLLLTAKFLYNNVPVEAVGDAEAAEIANAVLARRDPSPTPSRALTSKNASTTGEVF